MAVAANLSDYEPGYFSSTEMGTWWTWPRLSADKWLAANWRQYQLNFRLWSWHRNPPYSCLGLAFAFYRPQTWVSGSPPASAAVHTKGKRQMGSAMEFSVWCASCHFRWAEKSQNCLSPGPLGLSPTCPPSAPSLPEPENLAPECSKKYYLHSLVFPKPDSWISLIDFGFVLPPGTGK